MRCCSSGAAPFASGAVSRSGQVVALRVLEAQTKASRGPQHLGIQIASLASEGGLMLCVHGKRKHVTVHPSGVRGCANHFMHAIQMQHEAEVKRKSNIFAGMTSIVDKQSHIHETKYQTHRILLSRVSQSSFEKKQENPFFFSQFFWPDRHRHLYTAVCCACPIYWPQGNNPIVEWPSKI